MLIILFQITEKGRYGNEEGKCQGADYDDLLSSSFVRCFIFPSFLDLIKRGKLR